MKSFLVVLLLQTGTPAFPDKPYQSIFVRDYNSATECVDESRRIAKTLMQIPPIKAKSIALYDRGAYANEYSVNLLKVECHELL